jgi:hypothetical protein
MAQGCAKNAFQDSFKYLIINNLRIMCASGHRGREARRVSGQARRSPEARGAVHAKQARHAP